MYLYTRRHRDSASPTHSITQTRYSTLYPPIQSCSVGSVCAVHTQFSYTHFYPTWFYPHISAAPLHTHPLHSTATTTYSFDIRMRRFFCEKTHALYPTITPIQPIHTASGSSNRIPLHIYVKSCTTQRSPIVNGLQFASHCTYVCSSSSMPAYIQHSRQIQR